MLTCCTSMHRLEEFRLPRLFTVSGYILASNGSKIPQKELNELMGFISAQFFLICAKWKEFFVTDTIKFYC